MSLKLVTVNKFALTSNAEFTRISHPLKLPFINKEGLRAKRQLLSQNHPT